VWEFDDALEKFSAMFLETSRRQRNRRVLVHGLFHCGRMFAEFMSGDGWSFRYIPDQGLQNLAAIAAHLKFSDLAYQIGGRITAGKFLHAARLLEQNKIVMHWVGSDAMDYLPLADQGKAEPWVTQLPHHWGVSEWMVREVSRLGLSCELVPLPGARVPKAPSPMPARFSVLVYVPDARRGKLYGLDRILQVASELPTIPFELVGLEDGTIEDPPQNLRIHRRFPELTESYRAASVMWRPTRHDGLSQMVLEALGHGRHVLWTYPFPGCVQVTEASDACEQISRLHQEHHRGRLEANWEGVRTMANQYKPEKIKRDILQRLEQILSV
jgi:hypothetical protein